MVDPFRLWQRCEPRSLMDAHKRFVGHEFEAAHSASADVAATGRVLMGMVESFGLGTNWEEVADICEPERADWIGGTRHLQRDENEQAILGFGKHAGVSLSVLASGSDAGYLRWLVGSDFPEHVRQVCSKALELSAEALGPWIDANYPRRAPKGSEAPQAAPAAAVDSQAALAAAVDPGPAPAAEGDPGPETKPGPGQQNLF